MKIIVKIYIINSSHESNIIAIKDTGVGYDTLITKLDDSKSHIGLENVKDRLESRVEGKLVMESEVGVGTTATVYIPKKELV